SRSGIRSATTRREPSACRSKPVLRLAPSPSPTLLLTDDVPRKAGAYDSKRAPTRLPLEAIRHTETVRRPLQGKTPMAMAFAQSMRALAADSGRWALARLLVVLALLGGWSAWVVLARVAIYEVTRTARLEVAQAGHPLATPVAGRVVVTQLVVGRDVQAGEVLVELDAAAVRLQHEEARQWSTALTAQRQARRQELVAEEVAQQDEQQAAHTALAEARARQRE